MQELISIISIWVTHSNTLWSTVQQFWYEANKQTPPIKKFFKVILYKRLLIPISGVTGCFSVMLSSQFVLIVEFMANYKQAIQDLLPVRKRLDHCNNISTTIPKTQKISKEMFSRRRRRRWFFTPLALNWYNLKHLTVNYFRKCVKARLTSFLISPISCRGLYLQLKQYPHIGELGLE